MTKIRDREQLLKFGKHIKSLREARSLSQEELANDADIPINQVGRIERGQVNTTLSTMLSLAKALNIPPKDILDYPS